MTADEAAAFLGVDRTTVYDFAGRGVIPHQRLGKRLLFRRGALVAWLDSSLCKATSTRKGYLCRFDVQQTGVGDIATSSSVNPWRLQTWLGHKRIDETMLYVHVAESHAREWPDVVHEAARTEIDPDKRIVAMLGARGKAVANTAALAEQNAAIVAA